MRRIPLNKPLLLSVASIAVAAVAVGAQLPDLAAAIVSRGLRADPTQPKLAAYMEGHKADLQTYVKRFNGRSLFIKPSPPKQPTMIADKPAAPPPLKAIESGPPTTYTGPAVNFVLGNEVWFKNHLTLSVGEESDGVKVIATDPPWKVRLGHAGGEYDVELFKKIDLFKDNKPRAQRDFPGLKPAPQAGSAAPAGQNEANP